MTTPRRVIGWDTETHLISRWDSAPPVVCLTLAGGPDTLQAARDHFNGCENSLLDEGDGRWSALAVGGDILDAFIWLCQSADIAVAHNAAYDLAVMMRHEPGLTGAIFSLVDRGFFRDTRIREQLMAIAEGRFNFDHRLGKATQTKGFPLSLLTKIYLDVNIDALKGDKIDPDNPVVPPGASWRVRYAELDGTPLAQWPKAAINYAVEDAEYAREVFFAQSGPLYVGGSPVVYDSGDVHDELPQTRAALALHLMSVQGLLIDTEQIPHFEAYIRTGYEKVRQKYRDLGILRHGNCRECKGTGYATERDECYACRASGHDPTAKDAPKSWKNAKGEPSKNKKRLTYLVEKAYERLGIPVPLTEKGSVSTSAETLMDSADPDLMTLAEGAFYEKLFSQYLPIIKKGANGRRITSRPNVLVRSGRTSWRGPNWQNPPRRGGMRECVVAAPGNVLASVDYSSQELGCLAQVCLDLFGHSRLAGLINEGLDPHLAYACEQFLHISYDEGLLRKKSGDQRVKDARQNAKIDNFGLPGGLGARGMVAYAKGYGVIRTLDECYDSSRAWKRMFPEMNDYFAHIAAMGERFTIKQVRSGRLRGDCYYTAACNTLFQGLGADITKEAAWKVSMACYADPSSPLYGCRPILFIHDELMVEGPEESAHLWAPEISRIMEEVGSRWLPDVAVTAEPALMPRWFKGAEYTTVDGRLVPWYPGLSGGETDPDTYENARLDYEAGTWRK